MINLALEVAAGLFLLGVAVAVLGFLKELVHEIAAPRRK